MKKQTDIEQHAPGNAPDQGIRVGSGRTAGYANLCPEELGRMRTLKEAAQLVGLPYVTVQRAVKAGLLPSYRLLNRRKYVTLADIYQQISSRN